ncbi:motility associated factor glycosyltransferase family protein [Clostridium botulinum]|uniref:motility associated factor glycosyltransferase family protein n=2 Tax=Clostridium botulinum TaxID=1491 RepID=UPI00174D95D7|nr:6-hydroxymethylpterin diphosphokinase MptE-like protein [Clostridium botulinum]MBD5644719.1 motility associated factor glycosyltransferase family protein [Clostridium botulinum]HDK7138009.1 motility associated factor glycosyltransferase family protein [Clostridium botulinum]HDK7141337.1 motility associated factor glycosyltransferase family protein [Clostridium botulinum]HDK7145160.1 motility associated factor glycosyltransferase family protein [Clostridium botulinum]HDK7148812.1 motility as
MNNNKRIIEIIKAKDNSYALKVNNKFVYSKFYPLKDAEKFIENNNQLILNKKYVAMYGIGFGYHAKEILKRIPLDSQLFLFDLDMEIHDTANEYNLLEDIKKDSRVKFILNNNKNFYKEFTNKLSLVEDIIVYEPLLKVLEDKYNDFKEAIKSYRIAKISLEEFQPIMKENEEENIKNNYKTIGEFLKTFKLENKPIIIASAGPSLEKDLEILKKKREHIKIFAVGRALDILMKNAIKPDVITILDPGEIVYNQIKGYENSDIPLCFISTGSRLAVEAYKGPKYMFFNKECSYNKENIIVETGKTVAIPTIDLAIKAGGHKIILCGQDMAFIDNKFHAGDNENIKESNFYEKVLGVDGTYLNTTSGMLEFKKGIERLIEKNKNIKFINSSKGAKIKGTIEKDLKELL